MIPVATLSANDAMWLNMDTPSNLMIIESVMWFDADLDVEAVRETLGVRMIARYPIFSWRPISKSGISLDAWEQVENFDASDHIIEHTLAEPGGPAQLQRYLEAQMSAPLDHARPLWQVHIVHGQDFAALILRLHHAMADGTALVRILLDLTTDASPNVADHHQSSNVAHGPGALGQTATSPSAPPATLARGTRDRIGNALTAVATTPLSVGITATRTAAHVIRLLSPSQALGWVVDTASGMAEAVDKLVVHRPPNVMFFGEPGVAKRAGWSQPLPLDQVKAVARHHGATVNDILMATLAGALRRYQLGHGQTPQDVVTMVPVNLRDVSDPLPPHLGNKFALVAVPLPLSRTSADERIAVAKHQMDLVKSGPEALMTFAMSHLIGTVGALTTKGGRLMVDYFSSKAIGVTTNVAGPPGPRYFAGTRVAGLLGWVPGASRQSLGVCIFSYNGHVWVGFKADATLLPDVENLVAAFDEEFESVVANSARTP